MRGKDERRGFAIAYPGITPACAGKSRTSAAGFPGCRDHPRVCGEKHIFANGLLPLLGSPPRVRGKVPCKVTHQQHQGITPACAGKSVTAYAREPQAKDHPRVCGEKKTTQSGNSVCTGSPPRVRGKAWRSVASLMLMRITPACAGKSKDLSCFSSLSQDHPRVCGEKTKKIP